MSTLESCADAPDATGRTDSPTLVAEPKHDDDLPLAIVDSAGRPIASTGGTPGACLVVDGHASLRPCGHGTWVCPCGGCPHRANFRSIPIGSFEDGGRSMIYCGRSLPVGSVADLLVLGPGAENDRDAVLDALAMTNDEVAWLHGLNRVFGGALDRDLLLADLVRHAESILPIADTDIWVPQRDRYVRVFAKRGPEVVRPGGTATRTRRREESLHEIGWRVLPPEECAAIDAIRELTEETDGARLVIASALDRELLGVAVFRLANGVAELDASQRRAVWALEAQLGLCLRIRGLLDQVRASEGVRRELEIARSIQRSLLPRRLPTGETFRVWAGCVAATHVGGDYYDVFDLEGNLGLLVADVSGHSVASGLIASSFRSSFRHFLRAGCPIDRILSEVNHALHEDLESAGHFLTAVYAVFDPCSRRLRWVNAGHNPPLVVDVEGSVRELRESSLVIGVLPEVEFPVGEIELEPGSRFVIYSDGIVENQNQSQERYGADRLASSLARHRHRSAKQLYHYLLKDMYVFQDEFYNVDDVTLVVLEVSGDSRPEVPCFPPSHESH